MTAATDFASELLNAARPYPLESHRFLRAVADGTLSRDALRQYAISIYTIATAFPKRITAVLSMCDEPEVRRSLIGNLLEEEGVVGFVPVEGLRIDPSRAHGALARRFALAAGATEEDLQTPHVRVARWFGGAIERGDWLGAFSYFAVGQEANVPPTFRILTRALVDVYGFDIHDLEFLTEHFTADERHGVESAHLIARIATTDAARAAALEGAKRGGMAWWALHRTSASDRAVA